MKDLETIGSVVKRQSRMEYRCHNYFEGHHGRCHRHRVERREAKYQYLRYDSQGAVCHALKAEMG
jgi:hypothetical protein